MMIFIVKIFPSFLFFFSFLPTQGPLTNLWAYALFHLYTIPRDKSISFIVISSVGIVSLHLHFFFFVFFLYFILCLTYAIAVRTERSHLSDFWQNNRYIALHEARKKRFHCCCAVIFFLFSFFSKSFNYVNHFYPPAGCCVLFSWCGWLFKVVVEFIVMGIIHNVLL